MAQAQLKDQKKQLVALVVLALVFVGVVLYMFVLRGARGPELASTPATAATPDPSTGGATPAPQPRRRRSQPASRLTFKDPFEPLVEEASAATGSPQDPAASAAPPPASADVSGTAPATGTSAVSVEPQPAPEPPPTTTPPDDEFDHRVRLLRISERRGEPMVKVAVDGKVHRAFVGEVFAGRFEVTWIDTGCAGFLYDGKPFHVCLREVVKL